MIASKLPFLERLFASVRHTVPFWQHFLDFQRHTCALHFWISIRYILKLNYNLHLWEKQNTNGFCSQSIWDIVLMLYIWLWCLYLWSFITFSYDLLAIQLQHGLIALTQHVHWTNFRRKSKKCYQWFWS